MTHNRVHIRELIIEKIAGTISEDDNNLLENAIKEDHHIQIMWEEMQQTLSSDKARTFFDNLDENKAWNKVEHKIEQTKSGNFIHTGFIKWASIAALFCIALSITIYYLLGGKIQPIT
ncbi:hypothetical protein [Pedobacter sp. NJ-S-72]